MLAGPSGAARDKAIDRESAFDELDSGEVDISGLLSDIEMEVMDVDNYVDDAKRSFQQLLAFVKTSMRNNLGLYIANESGER